MIQHRFHEPGCALLDLVNDCLDQGEVERGLHVLFEGLGALREEMPRDAWQRFCTTIIPEHPLTARIHEDPTCRHSFQKPRGYPGDAQLIDHLYGVERPTFDTPVGRAVNAWAMGRGPVRGVRHRREYLAHVLDREAQRKQGDLRVLSVACGHLREADLSAAMRCGWIRELVALDNDAESLERAVSVAPDRITPVKMSVARLPNRSKQLGKFDLIYSAGLYDYLDDRLARALTEALFEALEPGGLLLIGNFLLGVRDSAFMETFMGWPLIYRSESEIEGLSGGIGPERIAERSFTPDPYGVFGYLSLRKA